MVGHFAIGVLTDSDRHNGIKIKINIAGRKSLNLEPQENKESYKILKLEPQEMSWMHQNQYCRLLQFSFTVIVDLSTDGYSQFELAKGSGRVRVWSRLHIPTKLIPMTAPSHAFQLINIQHLLTTIQRIVHIEQQNPRLLHTQAK